MSRQSSPLDRPILFSFAIQSSLFQQQPYKDGVPRLCSLFPMSLEGLSPRNGGLTPPVHTIPIRTMRGNIEKCCIHKLDQVGNVLSLLLSPDMVSRVMAAANIQNIGSYYFRNVI